MRAALALILAILAAPAGAVPVTSPGPERVAVTVYRDLSRGNGALSLDWLNGYALVSETRRVRIPAGESDLRFEGVASGIIPQSAIVSGLPDGIVERNRDAFLLSPGTLLDGALGRRVHLRRTSKATGEVTEQEALIRSGSGGAVVLQTAAGFESLRCDGESETLVFPEVPPGLSPKPTLSVRTRASQPVDATVTLSYLATGFDWQANYIVQLSPDGGRASLFAWLTLASTDDTSFRDANTSAVAGRLNREAADVPPVESRPIRLQCWPHSTTSDIPPVEQGWDSPYAPAPPPPPPPAPMLERGGAEEIMVTGARTMRAAQEELGDVKLYRIPEPVTVAANSQKQVAMIDQPAVRIAIAYRDRLDPRDGDHSGSATRVLVTRNRTAEGLGIPLPAGKVALFGESRGRPVLLGEGSLDDLAVGEDVEIRFDESPGVQSRIRDLGNGHYELEVSNDSPRPVRYEAEFLVDDGESLRANGKLGRRDGRPLWSVTIPANGRRSLAYRVAG